MSFFHKYQKAFSITLLILIVSMNILVPVSVLAADEDFFVTDETDAGFNPDGTQIPRAEIVTEGIPAGGPEGKSGKADAGDVASKSIQALGTCSVGAILGRFLSNIISEAINELTDALKSLFTETIGTYLEDVYTDPVKLARRGLEVPIDAATQNRQGYNITQNTGKVTQKVVGGPSGLSLVGGIISITDTSKDSIMFCIINEIITYITQSTIKWINTGFKGNPVFIQNPGALIKAVGDREANSFIYSIANGVDQASVRGAHVLTDTIQREVSQGLIGYYRNNLSGAYTPPSPTLTDYQMTNPNYADWSENMERYNPVNRNNVTGSWQRNVFHENPALQRQVERERQLKALDIQTQNNYQNFTECLQYREDGSCEPGALRIITMGNQIKGESEARNLTKYVRAATANSFDSIITALVNALMRVAINKVFEATKK